MITVTGCDVYYYDEEDDRWHDEDAEPEEYGCLFGESCCMPGYHTTDECHTAEMIEEYGYMEGGSDV